MKTTKATTATHDVEVSEVMSDLATVYMQGLVWLAPDEEADLSIIMTLEGGVL